MYDDDKIAVSQQQGQYNNKGITNNEPRTDPAFVIMASFALRLSRWCWHQTTDLQQHLEHPAANAGGPDRRLQRAVTLRFNLRSQNCQAADSSCTLC